MKGKALDLIVFDLNFKRLLVICIIIAAVNIK